MLGSITPLGERGRGRRWGVTVSAYALASAGGGAIAGAAAGAVGAALSAVAPPGGPSVLWVAAATVLAGAAVDGALAAHLVPSSVLLGPRRQVNEDWLGRYRGWVTGVGFGFQLGLGVATIVTTAAVYSLLVVAVLSGSPVTGAVIGATFGLARAVPVLAVGRVRSPDAVLLVDARLRRWEPASARLAAIAQVAAAALLISAAAAR
jgi:sulfite exporter TauE/SafE